MKDLLGRLDAGGLASTHRGALAYVRSSWPARRAKLMVRLWWLEWHPFVQSLSHKQPGWAQSASTIPQIRSIFTCGVQKSASRGNDCEILTQQASEPRSSSRTSTTANGWSRSTATARPLKCAPLSNRSRWLDGSRLLRYSATPPRASWWPDLSRSFFRRFAEIAPISRSRHSVEQHHYRQPGVQGAGADRLHCRDAA